MLISRTNHSHFLRQRQIPRFRGNQTRTQEPENHFLCSPFTIDGETFLRGKYFRSTKRHQSKLQTRIPQNSSKKERCVCLEFEYLFRGSIFGLVLNLVAENSEDVALKSRFPHFGDVISGLQGFLWMTIEMRMWEQLSYWCYSSRRRVGRKEFSARRLQEQSHHLWLLLERVRFLGARVLGFKEILK